MKFQKTIILALGLALMGVQPVMAKHPKSDAEATEPAESTGAATFDLGAGVLSDAIELCQLVVDNRRAIIDALEEGGWNSEIDYDVGNAPFYKEISADLEYAGVGVAELWGFLENYPGYEIGYCSFEIESPQVKIDISVIDDLPDMTGELVIEGEKTNGAWRNDAANDGNANVFIHAYENADGFLYQITLIKNLDN